MVEYRQDRGSYGRFNVTGEQFQLCLTCDHMIVVLPACPDASGSVIPRPVIPGQGMKVECDPMEIIWQVNPGKGARAFSFRADVRGGGSDGLSFEHLRGNLLDDGGAEMWHLRVKLRRQDSCAPEVQSVLQCDDMEDIGGGEAQCGRRCHVALDDKNYRSAPAQGSWCTLHVRPFAALPPRVVSQALAGCSATRDAREPPP